MLIAGFVVAVLAALLHVYIWWLESMAWTSGAARAVFGTTREEAEATKQMAFNQGFYNLFLAVLVFLGVALHVAGHESVGTTLVLAGVGSMLAAALVLLLSSPAHRQAAIKQGALPLVAVLLTALGLS